MNEDDLLIRLEKRKAPWLDRIHWQTWISVISLVVSLSSALFTCQLVRVGDRQAKATEEQAATATQTLKDAKQASIDQKNDVERARKAAENSARAAEKLAEGMGRSARASELSANASREALSLNRRALVLSNQPNVVVFENKLTKDLAENQKSVVRAILGNFGKGTALTFRAQMWLGISPKRVFTYTPIVRTASVSDLPPGGNKSFNIEIELSSPLTADTIAKINDGSLTFYVYGIAEYYDDTLDKQRKYTLHWCHYYAPSSLDKLALSICEEHNGTTINQ